MVQIAVLAKETFPDEIGGVQTYVFESSRALAKKNLVNVIVQQIQENHPAKENIEGINILRVKKTASAVPLLASLANLPLFTKMLDSIEKIDVALIQHPFYPKALLKSRHKNVPQIFFFHASLPEEEKLEARKNPLPWFNPKKYVKAIYLYFALRFERKLERKAVEGAKKIICLSEFSKAKVQKLYQIPESKIEIIPGGVDPKTFTPRDKLKTRKELKLPKNKKILFTIRRLVGRMGLKELIEAMGEVKESHPSALLLIAGKGPMQAKLEKQIKEHGLQKHVRLLGAVEQKKLIKLYQAADVFIVPSQALEGFGLVTVEALSTGLPVLGTPIGGTKEILGKLDKKLLFAGIGQKEMADKIIEFLKKDDEGLHLRCRKFVLDNYTWEKIGQKIKQQCLEVMEA